MFNKLIENSTAKSPWLYHMNTGSCNGCDIEIVAALTPHFDAERFGCKLAGTPRHADIILITGPVTEQSKDRLIRTLEQVPEPYVVMAVGSCPNSCNVFKDSYSVAGPLEKYCHVDVSVSGCACKPEAIMLGVVKATEILKEKRRAMKK
ncbi:MAG: NADH-quinone oxidoreductase subunit B [Clostridiales bacterium]|nr:NADH-quinone oxidoreductase subunit B [Candidatus Cacconaster stercorequi]